jgi:hypothetical protein
MSEHELTYLDLAREECDEPFVETPELIEALKAAVREADENPDEGCSPEEALAEIEQWISELP